MDDCCSFNGNQILLRNIFTFRDGFGVGVYFHKMIDVMSVSIGKLNHFTIISDVFVLIAGLLVFSSGIITQIRYPSMVKLPPDTVYVAAFYQFLFLFPVDVGKNRLIAHTPENNSAYKKYLLYYNLLLNFMSISYY